MRLINIMETDNILVISPHPDDECIGVGGLLSLYGRQTDVWVLTDGSKCNMELSQHDIINIRKREFLNAMRYLKVRDYRMYNVKDKTLSYNLEMLNNQDISIYTKIFIPSNFEIHIDHISAYNIAMNMLKNQTKNNCEVYMYEITSPIKEFSHFLDVSQVASCKKESILFYESQLRIFDYTDAALSLNRFRACMMGLRESYVEVYNKIDWVYNESNLVRASELDKYKSFVNILVDWLFIENNKKGIEVFLINKGITQIAIYGYGVLGKCLYNILKNTSINVRYIIDKKFDDSDVFFVSPKYPIQDIDVIINTVIFGNHIFDDVNWLKEQKIIQLYQIIEEQMKCEKVTE